VYCLAVDGEQDSKWANVGISEKPAIGADEDLIPQLLSTSLNSFSKSYAAFLHSFSSGIMGVNERSRR
jgi:hypothetical protein